ncbi:MAG: hypothetical protein ACUBOA_10870 [Candidatus Loosdrechtia sp.]|uniref:hypothetical protein n=1 Tax=Candidatus Loosdrechtia sp. TaxID=3101272 RepID=UPI003A70C9BE|nr:MAG: hypothetical protein QY305_07880 [Candidatus Jettenia sp. AMX2]
MKNLYSLSPLRGLTYVLYFYYNHDIPSGLKKWQLIKSHPNLTGETDNLIFRKFSYVIAGKSHFDQVWSTIEPELSIHNRNPT